MDKLPGLSQFDWLHIASHMFADTRTGRLSGIVLWDRDIWIDQLLDLAPLPHLVTFSGCNSIYTYLHQGDEHVGLPTTCFVAGANTIIGSIWSILDISGATFMAAFYNRYFHGLPPALAIVETQREMMLRGEDLRCWAGFVCMGIP
jgi:CHAT domain-containing protein